MVKMEYRRTSQLKSLGKASIHPIFPESIEHIAVVPHDCVVLISDGIYVHPLPLLDAGTIRWGVVLSGRF